MTQEELEKQAKRLQDMFGGIKFEDIKKESDAAVQKSFDIALEGVNAKLDKILKHLGIE